MLMFGIYAGYGGRLLLDATSYANNVQFSTNEHGFDRLSAFIRMPIDKSFQRYDQIGSLHVAIYYGAFVVWEGRIEDVSIQSGGIQIVAYGYQRALSDVPYTALWSKTTYDDFRPILVTELFNRRSERYEIDLENRIFIAPRKNESFGGAASDLKIGSMVYVIPDQSVRELVAISFDYAFIAPTNWIFQCNATTSAYGSSVGITSVNATGALLTGSINTTFSARNRVAFEMLYNVGAATTYTGETGDAYVRITNLRIKTTTTSTVYADEIADALIAYVNGVNSTHLSSSTSLTQSPTLDLRDELYEDMYPSDILNYLVKLGDNQTTPRMWEWGVYEGQKLHLRPKGDAARQWYVDISELELERTIDSLHNSVYVTYKEANGGIVRTSTSADSASITRYGLTRRAVVNSDTTNATQAGTHRDTVLADRKEPLPKARIEFDAVFNANGARCKLWEVRSGDQITIRNLPPSTSASLDKIRSFRISTTEYDTDSKKLSVSPELPIDTLEFMLARKQKGF
jgi:hypothetical protein